MEDISVVENNDVMIDDFNNKYLSFFILDTLYSVELSSVIEIIGIQRITYVPNVPKYIKGVINLRGKIIPVIDMGIKFDDRPVKEDYKTCIIVVAISGEHIGFMVDMVSEVVTINNQNISSLPEFNNINHKKFLNYLIKIDGKVILNLDIYKIFQLDSTL